MPDTDPAPQNEVALPSPDNPVVSEGPMHTVRWSIELACDAVAQQISRVLEKRAPWMGKNSSYRNMGRLFIDRRHFTLGQVADSDLLVTHAIIHRRSDVLELVHQRGDPRSMEHTAELTLNGRPLHNGRHHRFLTERADQRERLFSALMNIAESLRTYADALPEPKHPDPAAARRFKDVLTTEAIARL